MCDSDSLRTSLLLRRSGINRVTALRSGSTGSRLLLPGCLVSRRAQSGTDEPCDGGARLAQFLFGDRSAVFRGLGDAMHQMIVEQRQRHGF